MNENIQKIIALYDGNKSSTEVAKLVGLSARYVRRIATKYNLPRLHEGAQPGERNHQFVTGRRIDLDGYVVVSVPASHPYGRTLPGRKMKIIYEHRKIMEDYLGYYLPPSCVVDHIDGLTLHNDIKNLRLFENNGEHLRVTITGKPKLISERGRQNIRLKSDPQQVLQLVDTYYLRKKQGDVRLRAILLAALSLGIDSPYLLGTHHYLTKAGIGDFARSNLQQALVALNERWEQLLRQ
jgi:hypothetical protein